MAFQWKPIKNLFNCQSVTFNTFTGTQRRANHDHFPKDCQHSPFGSNAVTNSHHCLLHLQSTGLNMLTISALLSTPCYQLITTHWPPKCATTWPSSPAVPEAPRLSQFPNPTVSQAMNHFPTCPLIPSTKAEGEGYDRGWDGWMASLIQWTWVWASSGSWWWTGKPDVFMGSQKAGHDWVTELKWTEGPLKIHVHYPQMSKPLGKNS